MNLINIISRVIVGGVFFVSGMIKANDIMGFSYKLEEYFSPEVFNMPFMEHYVVPLAAIACIAEIVLGLAVILGAKMRLATWSLFGLTVFFAFLTWYSWIYDAVKECGCFGDALSLTPKESFYKDIFLMVFVVILLFSAKRIKLNTAKEDMIVGGLGLVITALLSIGIFDWILPVILYIVLVGGAILIKNASKSNAKEWIMAAYVTVLTAVFGFYTYNYLPVKDYRAYAIGKSIPEQMKTAEELGIPGTTYYTLYTLENEQGDRKQVRSDIYLSEKIWQDKSWKLLKDLSEGPFVLKKAYEPKIADFKIDTYEGEDVTDEILAKKEALLVMVFKDIDEGASDPDNDELYGLVKTMDAKVKTIALSPNPYETSEEIRHENGLAFPFYQGDGIVLKTFVRANPGLVLLKEGVVLGKWHNNALPSESEINELLGN